MAVNKLTDVGAVIAEAIDSYYDRASWMEDYCSRVRTFVEQLNIRSIEEQQLHEAKSPLYRRGYKSGWAHAHRNPDVDPNPGDRAGEEREGYLAGHGVSKSAQTTLKHYDDGNIAGAQEAHLGVLGAHQDALKRVPSGVKPQDYKVRVGDWMHPGKSPELKGPSLSLRHSVDVIRKVNQGLDLRDDEHHNDAPHPLDLGDSLHKKIQPGARFERLKIQRQAKQDKKAAEMRGDAHAAVHGVYDLPSLMEYKEGLERLVFSKDTIKAHDKGRLHHAGLAEFRGRDHSVAPEDAKDPDAHDPHGAAKVHAHDLWVKQIIKNLEESQKYADEEHLLRKAQWPAVEPHPDYPGAFHIPDHDDRSVTFDPVQYVRDRFAHPNGYAGNKSALHALRQQLGEGFTQTRFRKDDPAKQVLGVSKHPLNGKVLGVTKRLASWMHRSIPEFHTEHPMWEYHFGIYGAKGGHAKRRGKSVERSAAAAKSEKEARVKQRGKRRVIRRQVADQEITDAITYVVDAFKTWVLENVDVPEGRNIEEEIWSKVSANYGHLFEVEYS